MIWLPGRNTTSLTLLWPSGPDRSSVSAWMLHFFSINWDYCTTIPVNLLIMTLTIFAALSSRFLLKFWSCLIVCGVLQEQSFTQRCLFLQSVCLAPCSLKVEINRYGMDNYTEFHLFPSSLTLFLHHVMWLMFSQQFVCTVRQQDSGKPSAMWAGGKREGRWQFFLANYRLAHTSEKETWNNVR